jgi:hypothetical protein
LFDHTKVLGNSDLDIEKNQAMVEGQPKKSLFASITKHEVENSRSSSMILKVFSISKPSQTCFYKFLIHGYLTSLGFFD